MQRAIHSKLAKDGSRTGTDPRHYQLFCQLAILAYGLKYLDFARFLTNVPAVVTACLVAQLAGVLALRYRRNHPVALPFDWRSPTISALSLALLLRTNEPWIAVAAGLLSIGSKFLIRVNGKHVFNPSLFGIIAMLVLFPGAAWVSPGQWGREGLLLFFVACAGGFVLFRALRSDIAAAFLFSYALLLGGRALWLGDPWPIVLNQFSSGSLLIFAFFMISDPKSTPDSRTGRVIFAALSALIAFAIQFGLYNSNGLLWSLFLCAFSVPLIDHFFKRNLTRNLDVNGHDSKNSIQIYAERKAKPAAPALTGAGK